jgi:hypothetical protein
MRDGSQVLLVNRIDSDLRTHGMPLDPSQPARTPLDEERP